MDFSGHVAVVLTHAVAEARQRRHEFVTLEHVLLAMTREPGARSLLRLCGVDTDRLAGFLEGFFRAHVEPVPQFSAFPRETPGLMRVLAKGPHLAREHGHELVLLADMLQALYEEPDAYARHYLRKLGLRPEDIADNRDFVPHTTFSLQHLVMAAVLMRLEEVCSSSTASGFLTPANANAARALRNSLRHLADAGTDWLTSDQGRDVLRSLHMLVQANEQDGNRQAARFFAEIEALLQGRPVPRDGENTAVHCNDAIVGAVAHAGERQRGAGASAGDGEAAADAEQGAGGEFLDKYAVDLTALAEQGRIDPLIGREAELERTIEILCRRRKNNPLFVGEPGVGKTAMAEGLALRISQGQVPERFRNARMYSLNISGLIAGARWVGDWEKRVKGILEDLRRQPNAILFVDEFHTMVGAGANANSDSDIADMFKPELAAGRLRCVGATTHEEYRRHVESDAALARRFQRVEIGEPSHEDCVAILRGVQSRYAEYHKVNYSGRVLKAAVELSARFVQDRLLPDKAIDVIDEVGAMLRLKAGDDTPVNARVGDVEKVVARMAGVPQRSVSGRERDRLATLEQDLLAVIFGQDAAVSQTVRAVLRSRAGLKRDDKPAGSFLFYGPTGVGKTELARQLAAHLGVQFVRFDMSEYMEEHSVAKLIGAPPGYVGYNDGGLLVEAVRKHPYSLVLLDEIEKAHPDVFNVLLQVMDHANLTDTKGRKANFANVILIMTSNAGAFDMAKSGIGFGHVKGAGDAAARGLKAVHNTFSPEFRNRLDALIPFNGLTPDLMGRIVDKFLRELEGRLKGHKVRLELSEAARAWLADAGYDPDYGARPMLRVMRSELEDPLSQELLFGGLTRGGVVRIERPAAGKRRKGAHVEAGQAQGRVSDTGNLVFRVVAGKRTAS